MRTLKNVLRKYFETAAGTPMLIFSFVGVLVMLKLVFPALPIHGELIDQQLSYTLMDIEALMNQYGDEGRAHYALASATVDTAFPLLYVTFFSGLLYRFRPLNSLWVLAFIPVVTGIWDLCENAQIIAMLVQFPDISARQVAVASFFTTVKQVLSAFCELSALVFLCMYFVRRLKQGFS